MGNGIFGIQQKNLIQSFESFVEIFQFRINNSEIRQNQNVLGFLSANLFESGLGIADLSGLDFGDRQIGYHKKVVGGSLEGAAVDNNGIKVPFVFIQFRRQICQLTGFDVEGFDVITHRFGR